MPVHQKYPVKICNKGTNRDYDTNELPVGDWDICTHSWNKMEDCRQHIAQLERNYN